MNLLLFFDQKPFDFIIPYAFRVSVANRVKFNVEKGKRPKYKRVFIRTLRKIQFKFMSIAQPAKMHTNPVLPQVF